MEYCVMFQETVVRAISVEADNLAEAKAKARVAVRDGSALEGQYVEWVQDSDIVIEDQDGDHTVHAVKRHTARFVPQAWVRDNAVQVDPKGPTEWDCTEAFDALPLDYQAMLTAAMPGRTYGGQEEALDRHDLLQKDPAAPEWIRKWSGPFNLYVREAE